jgi:hypothetical protein
MYTFEYLPIIPEKELAPATIEKYERTRRQKEGVKKEYIIEPDHNAKTYRVIGKDGDYLKEGSLRCAKQRSEKLREDIEKLKDKDNNNKPYTFI